MMHGQKNIKSYTRVTTALPLVSLHSSPLDLCILFWVRIGFSKLTDKSNLKYLEK